MHNFNLVDRLPTSFSCEPPNTSQQDSVYPSLYVMLGLTRGLQVVNHRIRP